MLINIQDDIIRLHATGVLERLLLDKTTRKNMMWGTDAYSSNGKAYDRNEEIKAHLITGENTGIIKTRARKAFEQQSARTKQHAEVFTPLWVCKKMIDHADEIWFGRPGAFDNGDEPVAIPKRRKWQHYVDSRRLEITCGEAPYLVSRYDVSTAEIIPIEQRTGILDRKLRIVNENAETEEEWIKWAFRAFEATYGYEFQGDNLLIARVNFIMTFTEYLEARWQRLPSEKEYNRLANIIAWNLWQMNGLSGTIPYGNAEEEYQQIDFFDLMDIDLEKAEQQPRCKIYDWRRDNSLTYLNVNKGGRNMKFDFAIGNPPYQEPAPGGSTSDKPIYHLFMDEVIKVAKRTELITPARFLFNAGGTPKEWNQKMLASEHFKVLFYEPDAKKIFPNTVFTGGVAITLYDAEKHFFPIGTFIPYNELNSARQKVVSEKSFLSLSNIVSGRTPYLFTDLFLSDHPEAREILSKGHHYDISSNAFESLPEIFLREEPQNTDAYYSVLGRLRNQRTRLWIRKLYARGRNDEFVTKWKVFLPKANGASGMLGDDPARLISKPEVGKPSEIATDTFLCVGGFDSQNEAQNLEKYLLSKFARALLGTLKVTQINAKETWRNVPLQDFTSESDIDWSKSIPEIDQQLYAKYGLTKDEIDFIESHVKEMK